MRTCWESFTASDLPLDWVPSHLFYCSAETWIVLIMNLALQVFSDLWEFGNWAFISSAPSCEWKKRAFSSKKTIACHSAVLDAVPAGLVTRHSSCKSDQPPVHCNLFQHVKCTFLMIGLFIFSLQISIAFPDEGSWKRFHMQLQHFPISMINLWRPY